MSSIRTLSRNAGLLLAVAFAFFSASVVRAGNVNAVYNSASDVPVTTSNGYDATGLNVTFTLNFAPPVGTNLMVVKLTGSGTINGVFTNLAQSQAVPLSYGGQIYNFVANYFGGTGNDLVLQWAGTRVLAWGSNAYGELGNSNTTPSNVPVVVASSGVLSGKTIVALAGGYGHTLALCSDGTLAAWGANSNGQLGNNGGATSSVPVAVSTTGVLSTKRVIAVASGSYHCLALCSDGTVVTWGYNNLGQLGNGSTATSGVPVAVNTSGVLSGKKVVAIAAGKYHSVALLSTGAVVAWGDNLYGQLGNNSTTPSSVPVAVSATGPLATSSVVSIASGMAHCLALCANGTLAAWGDNSDGEFGNNGTTSSSVPVAVTTTGTFLASRSVTSIAAGGYHNLALCSDGTVAAWGQSNYGQLGTISGSHLLPAGVNTTGTLLNKTVSAIAGGYAHSLALCSDGTLTAWGGNSNGELGTGSNNPSSVPQNASTSPLLVGERYVLPASGPAAFHSAAIVASPANGVALTTGTLISNGSFESGFTNWSVSDINGPGNPLQIRTGGYNPGEFLFLSAPTDNTHAATSGFDGSGPGVIRLAHDVAVTANEPFIRFDWRVGWDMLSFSGSTKPRTFAVTIEPGGGGPVMLSTIVITAAPHTKNLDNGPQTGFVDLSAYISTTVRVCFDLTVPEAYTGRAFFQLDNVRTAALQPASVNPLTQSATAINIEGATLNGLVNGNGKSTTVQFEYGTTIAYGSTVNATPPTLGGNTDTPVSAMIYGFEPNVTLHYRLKTTTIDGVKVGADKSFTTLPHAPSVSGLSSVFGVTSASLSAQVNPDSASTVVAFEYGLTDSYGSSTPAWESPITTAQTVHGQVSGIVDGVTYHFRVKATNAAGTTYSEDSIFEAVSTPPGSPTASTRPATLISRSSVTLNGIFNAGGSLAPVDFQLGTTTNYNLTVTPSSSANGSSDVSISAFRGSLSPGTTYHYRARAHGSSSDVYGQDLTFTTNPIGFPVADTGAAEAITQTTAILTGSYSADNGPVTTAAFEYGLDTNYGATISVFGSNHDVNGQFPLPSHATIPVAGDSVTYHYRLKATNNIGTTYGQDMTFTTPDPHEARLYGLTLGEVPFSPAFDRLVTSYSVSLPFKAAGLVFAPQASTGIASVLINGVSVSSGSSSDPLPVKVGNNVFNIVVTALDGVTTQTYTVNVTRTAPVPGDLDLSFNGTGAADTDFGVSDNARAVVIQPDGRILVAGSAQTADYTDFGVARYNPDGSLDTSFGGTGKVTTDIGGGGDVGYGMALQSDGKIVVVGNAIVGSVTQFAVVRYNPDGTLDTTFNGTGKVLTPVGTGFSSASAVAVLSDGKIVVAGDADFNGTHGYALLRYHGRSSTGTPGTLDTTFNSTGMVLTSVSGEGDYAASMLLQGDGKMVVGGYSYVAGNFDSSLVRYNADGSLDETFNGTGKLLVPVSTGDDLISALALQADGKIVAVGAASNGTDYDFSIMRFHGDSLTGAPGTLDTTFNSTGKIVAPIGASDDRASGVALQSDGKIVVSGWSLSSGYNECVVARFNTDGSPDLSFHGSGTVITDFGGINRTVGGVALQDDGKIVVATSTDTNLDDFSVLRFLNDGPGISVELPVNTALFDGISFANLGGALPATSRDVEFTLRNTGVANLSGLNFSIDGLDASEFTLVGLPAGPLAPQAGASFTIRFTPAVVGVRGAALHILSSVTGNMHSFDLSLVASGFAPLEDWRFNRFGNDASNAAIAGDNADPNNNGIPNLLEYALNGDPTGSSTGNAILPQSAQGPANALQLSFTRYQDHNDITLTVQACDDLTGPWTDLAQSVNGGAFTVITTGAALSESGTGNARSVTVGDLYPTTDPDHPHRFMRLQVTRP